MKPRRSPHLLLLLLALLLAAGWRPCAETRGMPAFRLEATDALLEQPQVQPLLVQTGQTPGLQPTRELPLESDAARPLRLRVAVHSLPPRITPPALPVSEPLRPSWRGLVSFPLPPPAGVCSPA